MQRWWERFPQRLELEEEALRKAGFRYVIDEAAGATGRLEITVFAPHPLEAGEIELLVRFPDSYPYFPPLVFTREISLSRHQHPTEGLLCLLANEGEDWRPESDRLATLIQGQLPELARTATAKDPDDVSESEAHQGEPLTAFLDYEPYSHVSAPPMPHEQGYDRGTIILGLESCYPLRGAVLRIFGDDDTVIAEASEGLQKRYSQQGVVEVRGRWYRLPNRPESTDPEGLLAELNTVYPDEKHLWRPMKPPVKGAEGRDVSKLEVMGLIFEDELAWRDYGFNWLIIANRRYAKPLPGGNFVRSALIKSELESHELRKVRIPELAPLAEKKVSIFGLGSLGSVAVMELARARLSTMALLDGALLEIGNGARWADGRRYAGLPKVQALNNLILEGYPHTQIQRQIHRIGSSLSPAVGQDPTANLDGEVIDSMVEGADLVLDASASIRLNHYLADIAAERAIPYIWMSTTNGGWGGLVGRIIPGKTGGCWMCHLHGLNDGSISLPASRPNDQLVQPAGCMDPTFTGASFDIAEVTMMGVRLVVSTLCGEGEDAYPGFDWNLAIVDLRDSTGRPVPPQWRTYALDPHPDCCSA